MPIRDGRPPLPVSSLLPWGGGGGGWELGGRRGRLEEVCFSKWEERHADGCGPWLPLVTVRGKS